MPIVRVYGMPDSAMDLTPLIKRIRGIFANDKSLEIKPNETAVFFPQDMHKLYRGEDIFILVDGVPQTISSTRQALAEEVAGAIEIFARKELKRHKLVRVLVRSLDRGDGFCKIEIPTIEGD